MSKQGLVPLYFGIIDAIYFFESSDVFPDQTQIKKRMNVGSGTVPRGVKSAIMHGLVEECTTDKQMRKDARKKYFRLTELGHKAYPILTEVYKNYVDATRRLNEE